MRFLSETAFLIMEKTTFVQCRAVDGNLFYFGEQCWVSNLGPRVCYVCTLPLEFCPKVENLKALKGK
jgi:hypothetical protein